jgi:uncharacterized membrane protein
VAGVGAIAQLAFARLEIFVWGDWFVASAAPSWVDHQELATLTGEMKANIAWAENLADNMGVYNLVLALGLAWVAAKGRAVAHPLGTFLAIWLLVAAAAAGFTSVYKALALQGLLGLALLYALKAAPERSGGMAGLGAKQAPASALSR